MLYSQSGEILTDSANFMFPLLNDALEWFANEMNNHGVGTFEKQTFLTNVLAITVNDPGIQVNISDTGYFDGTQNHQLPQVPTDLNVPLFLWERQHGSAEEWIPMTQALDGLPSYPQGDRLKWWEWRSDTLAFVGATQNNDIRLRYASSHPLLATPKDILFFRGATGCVAYKMVSTYLASKNPEAAQMADSVATSRASQLTTRNARMKQTAPTTRQSYGNLNRGNTFYPPRNS